MAGRWPYLGNANVVDFGMLPETHTIHIVNGTVVSGPPCGVCGKMASNFVNVTLAYNASTPSRFEPRCEDHDPYKFHVTSMSEADIRADERRKVLAELNASETTLQAAP